MDKILIVEDDIILAETLKKLFLKRNLYAEVAANGKEALKKIKENPNYSIVLTDLVMPEMGGMVLIEEIKKIFPEMEVVVMTGYGDIKTAVEAMKKGASDFITKPFDKEELFNIINKILKREKIEEEIKKEKKKEKVEIIGQNHKFVRILEKAKVAAKTDFPILILGESGTGKELLARFIHENSNRKENIFLPINCSAIPSELIESELFGYRKGAFTGATKDFEGVFKAAEGGTLLLDEISEMPLNSQAKLLRVIETKKIKPLGYTNEIEVDVRIIATSNLSLKELLSGKLRQDLYYRFVIVIEVPPLRERKEDIKILFDYFVEKYSKSMGINKPNYDSKVIEILNNYSFPGNVRELENISQRIITFYKENIGEDEILSLLKEIEETREIEKENIIKVINECNGNKKKAAEILGISRATLYRKLREFNIEI
ncbi:MAG: sigma-54 dependent transcriptional regulator [Candidatus Hydrothermales bacterium]